VESSTASLKLSAKVFLLLFDAESWCCIINC
jgi:hypothetical protein